MNRNVAKLVAVVAVAGGVSIGIAADNIDHRVSVREVMISAIAPATDTLWGAEDPQTDEEWKELEDAAIVVIATGTLIKDGGSGPNDMTWAADATWQQFAETMTEAGVGALAAVRARDMDALMTATGEVLYPPCEECHLAFHPELSQAP